jgi:hypothetical protein
MSRATAAILDPLLGVDPGDVFNQLCAGCVREFDITGAGVALIVANQYRGLLGASDDRSRLLEELQFTTGEGPCMDAHHSGRLVVEPRLDLHRWPAFSRAAVAAGVSAVFALPLQLGAARFGALDFYRDVSGPLDVNDLDDAWVVADAATGLVSAMQTDQQAGDLHEMLEDVVARRAVVHQATGVVAVQLDVSVEDALVVLRSRAFRTGVGVGELAEEIMAGRVRFDER